MKIRVVLGTVASMLILGACGGGGGEQAETVLVTEEVTVEKTSEPSTPATDVPEYRVDSVTDYPLEDANGSIPAKSVVAYTEATSDPDLQDITDDIRKGYTDQDVVGVTFSDLSESEFRQTGFFVWFRDGRAARAMNVTDEEFEDGGIVVNPLGTGPSAQSQPQQQAPAAEEEGGVGIATIRVSGTESLAFQGFLTSFESSRSVEGTVPATYEIEYQTGLFAADYVSADMSKAFTTNPQPGTLRVEIVVDGQVVNSTETSSEYGNASVSWDTASGSQ